MTNREIKQVDKLDENIHAPERQFPSAAITNIADNRVQLREQITQGLKTLRITQDGQNSLVIDRLSEGKGLEQDPRAKATDRESQLVTEQFKKATAQILESAAAQYGSEGIERLHIESDDIGSAVAVLVLAPDICQLLGYDRTRHIGRRMFVFAVVPALGAAEHAQNECQKNPVGVALESAKNISVGTLTNTPIEMVHPVIGALALAYGGASFIHDQLYSPRHKERNSRLQELATRIDSASDKELLDLAIRSKHLLSSDVYKSAFDTATSGIKPNGNLLKEVLPDLPTELLCEQALELNKSAVSAVLDNCLKSLNSITKP